MSIKETSGFISFRQEGRLKTEAGKAMLVLTLDMDRQLEQLLEFDLTMKCAASQFETRMHVSAEVEGAQRELGQLMETLERDQRLNRRNTILAWIGGLLGLYNTAQIHDVNGRLGHTNQAVRDTVIEADALKEYSEHNDKNIMKLKGLVNGAWQRLQVIEFREACLDTWVFMKIHVEALVDTVVEALQHKLSWRAVRLIDLQGAVNKLAEQVLRHERRLDLEYWQQIFQLEVSFLVKKGKVFLIMEIPLASRSTNEMELYRWEAAPLRYNGSLWTVRPERQYIAVEKKTGTSIGLKTEELERCWRVGKTAICQQNLVQYTRGSGTCIQALWEAAAEKVMTRCQTSIWPLSERAWSVETGFVVTSAKGTDALVTCGTEPTTVHHIPEGMWKVSLLEGCTAASRTWTLINGGQIVDNTTVKEMTTDEIKNWVPKELQIQGSLDEITHPKSVESMKAKVEYELSRGGWSTAEIVALTLAAIAIVGVAAFILYLWVRLKGGAFTESGIRTRQEALQEATMRLSRLRETEAEEEDERAS